MKMGFFEKGIMNKKDVYICKKCIMIQNVCSICIITVFLCGG